jgi:hypothetical protein
VNLRLTFKVIAATAILASLPLGASAQQAPPVGCPANALPFYQVRGVPDNFAGPTDPRTPSVGMTGFLTNVIYSAIPKTRDYDYMLANSLFGDSFSIPQVIRRRICSATLTLRIKGSGASNDGIAVGTAISTPPSINPNLFLPGSNTVWNSATWTTTTGAFSTQGLSTVTKDINAGQLTSIMISTGILDVYIQDDTAVDFMILNGWYF